MSTAHFQLLTPKWMALFSFKIGILRVFENPNKAPPDEYKFFIVCVIFKSICNIHGMYNSQITRKNYRAISDKLRAMGVVKAEWTHDGRRHIIK
jgi:hypothetical protein